MSGKNIKIEESLLELDKMLDEISDENTPLDESINLYAKAAKIILDCDGYLKNAAVKIEEIDESLASIGNENEL